jgi:GTP-binding protein Era
MSTGAGEVGGGFRCGYVTLLGRPNTGKSTLLNRLLEQKISITSRKPQTTRHQLLGIKSGQDYQAIYIDTPGIQWAHDTPVHRYMSQEARSSLETVDLVVFLIEAMKWREEDAKVLSLVRDSGLPVILAINKIDRLEDKSRLLPFIGKVSGETGIREIIPLSAKTGDNVDELEKTVRTLLPEAPPLYAADQVTDRNERFFAAEFVREKLINRLGDELPYRVAVTIEEFTEQEELISIKAVIWVESRHHKGIVVGSKGEVLKAVGEAARRDMEVMFGRQVYLETWVKLRKNWTTDEKSLGEMGFTRR